MKTFEQVINIKDKLKGVTNKLLYNQFVNIGMLKKVYDELVNNPVDTRPYKVYSALATFTTNEVSPGGFDYSLTVLENTFTETVTSAQTIGGNLEFSIPNTDATKGVAFVVSQSAVAFTVFPVTYVYDSSGTAVASFEVTAEMADSGTRYLEFRVYN